jgi:hypothetical protein
MTYAIWTETHDGHRTRECETDSRDTALSAADALTANRTLRWVAVVSSAGTLVYRAGA